MYEGMPDELRQKLPHDIRLYMRNFWQHPNDPTREYDFHDDTGEKFLHYLAHDDGPLVPENWGDIVLLNFARGCLKTTTAVGIADGDGRIEDLVEHELHVVFAQEHGADLQHSAGIFEIGSYLRL